MSAGFSEDLVVPALSRSACSQQANSFRRGLPGKDQSALFDERSGLESGLETQNPYARLALMQLIHEGFLLLVPERISQNDQVRRDVKAEGDRASQVVGACRSVTGVPQGHRTVAKLYFISKCQNDGLIHAVNPGRDLPPWQQIESENLLPLQQSGKPPGTGKWRVERPSLGGMEQQAGRRCCLLQDA